MFKNWSDRTCLASPGIPVLRSFLTSPGANLLIISPCIQWFPKIFVHKIISSILGLIEFYPFFEFKRKLRSMKSTFFFIFFLFSINSIAQAITKLAGIPYHPTILPSRPNDVDRLAANTKKAKKLLDFTSLVAIDEGLSRYISWMKTTYPNPSRLLSKIPLTNW